ANASDVTARAEIFFVAIGAELRVVAAEHFLALDEVRTVKGVVHPPRRHERSRREHRFDDAAFAIPADVARVARALGVAARHGVGLLMAAEAAFHPRELIARRELELLDRSVALAAADVSDRVRLVVEDH